MNNFIEKKESEDNKTVLVEQERINIMDSKKLEIDLPKETLVRLSSEKMKKDERLKRLNDKKESKMTKIEILIKPKRSK